MIKGGILYVVQNGSERFRTIYKVSGLYIVQNDSERLRTIYKLGLIYSSERFRTVPNGSELYIKYILYIVQNGSERFRTIYTARTNPNYFELLRTNPN